MIAAATCGLVMVAIVAATAATTTAGASEAQAPGNVEIIHLLQQWNLIGWAGADTPVGQALSGTAEGTNDISSVVDVVWNFDAATQTWSAFFPAAAGVAGANDLTDMKPLHGYFIHATGDADWLVAVESEAGAAGPAGPPGPQGPTGATGPQGIQGEPGQDGATILSGSGAPADTLGKTGDFYLDTSNGALYGPKTDIGWPDSSISLVGPKGETGQAGADGKDGKDGKQGVAGTNGATILSGSGGPGGTTGGNVGDFYIDTANGVLYGPKTDAGWPATGLSLVGPKGDQGAPGARATALGEVIFRQPGTSTYAIPTGTASLDVELWSGGGDGGQLVGGGSGGFMHATFQIPNTVSTCSVTVGPGTSEGSGVSGQSSVDCGDGSIFATVLGGYPGAVGGAGANVFYASDVQGVLEEVAGGPGSPTAGGFLPTGGYVGGGGTVGFGGSPGMVIIRPALAP